MQVNFQYILIGVCWRKHVNHSSLIQPEQALMDIQPIYSMLIFYRRNQSLNHSDRSRYDCLPSLYEIKVIAISYQKQQLIIS